MSEGQAENVIRILEDLARQRAQALGAKLEDLQEQFKRLCAQLVEDASASDSAALSQIAAEVARGLKAGFERARMEAFKELSFMLSALAEQRTQAQILRELISSAARFSPRVALFLSRGDNIVGWAARGFSGPFSDDRIKALLIPKSADTLLAAAMRGRDVVTGGELTHADNVRSLLNFFGAPWPKKMMAIPLVVGDKAPAVLYADCGDAGPEAIEVAALEILVKFAGLAVHNQALISLVAQAGAPEAERRQAVRRQQAEPAVETEPAAASESAGSTKAVEIEPAPEAAMSLSATEAGKLAIASEDEKLHADAKRIARLLVQEIKLYNEQKVIEGRQNKDLYNRLKRDIDRSRDWYDKRVSPKVKATIDYFHEELVRTLADNDPANLGPNYPGAKIQMQM